METMSIEAIVIFGVIGVIGVSVIFMLIGALIKAEISREPQMEVGRSVLGEDYYLDYTGSGHQLTRTTRATDLSHLEIRDIPDVKDYK